MTIAECDLYDECDLAYAKSKWLPARLFCRMSPIFGAYWSTGRPRKAPLPLPFDAFLIACRTNSECIAAKRNWDFVAPACLRHHDTNTADHASPTPGKSKPRSFQ